MKPLKRFIEDRRSWGRQQFLDEFDDPFLLVQKVGGSSDEPEELDATSQIAKDTIEMEAVTAPSPSRARGVSVASLEAEPGTSLSIGRAPTNDLQILHAFVSKEHAELLRDREGAFRVRDRGSTNGTAVNYRPLESGEARLLNEADQLLLGGAISCTYLSPEGLYSYITSLRAEESAG